MKGFLTALCVSLAMVGSTSAWETYHRAPRHFQSGNWVYYQPALTAQSAPFSFYEKPKVRAVRNCCDTRKCRKVRKYVRRVVYRPYDRNCCCPEKRRKRWDDSCWH